MFVLRGIISEYRIGMKNKYENLLKNIIWNQTINKKELVKLVHISPN